MANNRKWPPVEPILIERLEEWARDETPPYNKGMTAHDCLVAMAERGGVQRILTKMKVIAQIQREE